MSTFTAIDISKLPAPNVVEEISFEQIFELMLADLKARDPSFTAMTESDPAYKILQVAAFREVLIRQRVNEACRAVMLPYANDGDLDNLGALLNVPRLLVDPGNPDAIPPVPATMESNTDFRRRIQLSPEGFSTAGPEGAYIFHALSATGSVLDASAISPSPGNVTVTVLSRVGDGTADSGLVSAVNQALSSESVRPLTDSVSVQSATIIDYTVNATLYFYSGPGNEEVLANAQAAIESYTADGHRLGIDVTLSGIYAALHQPGVQRVELASPSANISVDKTKAAFCTAIAIASGNLDE